jgi:hypothetical protein
MHMTDATTQIGRKNSSNGTSGAAIVAVLEVIRRSRKFAFARFRPGVPALTGDAARSTVLLRTAATTQRIHPISVIAKCVVMVALRALGEILPNHC